MTAAAIAGPDRLDADADPAALKRRSVRGAALTFGAQGSRIVLQFGSQIAMMRLLDPAAFGLIAMIMPVLSLVQIFNELGLTQATVQREEITQDELTALFWINVAISGGLAALMALAAPLVAMFYDEPRLIAVTVCSASLLLLSGVSAQQIALMNRWMQYRVLAVIDVACVVASVVAGVGGAALGLGYWSLVLMQAASSATIAALAWALSDWRPSRPRRGADVRALLRFGGHLTASNALGYAENNLGNILLGRLGGQVALGLYDRAFKLVIVPWWQISLPVSRVAVALLSRLRRAEPLYVRAHCQMMQGVLLTAVPGLVWAAMTAGLLVPMVLGQDWADAAPVVADLALAATLMPFGLGAYWLYISQGRVREQLRWSFVSAAAVILAMLLGVHWGPVGIARCYAALSIVIQGAPTWGATRRGPVNLRVLLTSAYPVFVGVAASAVAVRLSQPLMTDAGMGQAGTVCASLAVAYLSCVAALLCFPDGLRILRDIWALRSTLRAAPAMP